MGLRPAFVAFGLEGRLAGEHLVEESAEGVEIGATVELGGGGSAPLLGGGVRDGEQRAAGASEGGAGFLGGDDAEVGDLGLPATGVAGQEDVLRLDVAVDHAAGVRGCQAGGDLAGDVQRQGTGRSPQGLKPLPYFAAFRHD